MTIPSTGLIIEIGGSQVITYGKMMKIYADVRGLRRWLLPVPFLTLNSEMQTTKNTKVTKGQEVG